VDSNLPTLPLWLAEDVAVPVDLESAHLLRDQMDPLWDMMTKQERSRIRALSEDLNTLYAGGAKPEPP